MTVVVSFDNYRPPARFDSIPWTDARIEEAASEAGPFVAIDTVSLGVPDTNPANPRLRDFTTSQGTGPDQWYQVVFLDAALNESLPTDPFQNSEPVGGQESSGTGPCTDWLTANDVASCCDNTTSTDNTVFDDAAVAAQELLFQLTARQFPGVCERTVRPCRTRCGYGFQVLSRGHIVGWHGLDWWWGSGVPCGCRHLDRVKLAGYPVQEIVEVKIDGAIVDPATYRLDRKMELVRVRDPADPDTVLRWPGCQSLDLDDTQTGTFSVRYTYGQDPPLVGVGAAAELACELYKACAGQECALPRNAVRVSRQGVTVEKLGFVSWGFQSGKGRHLRGWQTGMPTVDAFLNAYAKTGITRRPVFWSPAAELQYPLPVEA